MSRHGLIVLVAGACLTAGCDNSDTGGGDGGARDAARDRAAPDRRVADWGPPPWDGFDPRCPLPGPCVLSRSGEGKHAADVVVIGEQLTLKGKNLALVDTVYVGAAPATRVQASATVVTCRVGPRTPPGDQTVELKFGTSRRMAATITVNRLVLIAAPGTAKVESYETIHHSAGAVTALGAAPDARPVTSAGGRYLVARLKGGALGLLDLALEQAASVSLGGGQTPAHWATDAEDRTLYVTSAAGKLFTVDLSAWPTLSAKPVAGAPPSAGVVGIAPSGLVVGLTPTAVTGKGSLWYAATDLKAFKWVASGGSPFVVGSGKGLSLVHARQRGTGASLLVADGASRVLATVAAAGGVVKGYAAVSVPGALGVAATSSHVALSRDAGSLLYAGQGGSGTKTIALPSAPAKARVEARALLSTQHGAVALTGPAPASGGRFKAAALEVVDLQAGQRLTDGGKTALTLADVRDAASDPVADVVHLITGTHYRSVQLTLAGKNVTVKEQHPNQLLAAAKAPRWIAVQP